MLARNGSLGGTEVWTQSPLCRAAAAPGTGGTGERRADNSSLGFAVRSCPCANPRDFGQPEEQFVNRRQDYFYLETLSLLAVALVMPLPVLVPGTSSTRCMQRAGGCSSSAERTPNLRASAFQDPAAGLGMGQLLKCQGGAQE